MRHLLVLLALALPSIALPAAGALAQARFEGRWTIIGIDDASPVNQGAEWVGRTVAFSRAAVAAPAPLDCEKPAYEILRVPPQGLFQGALAEADAVAFAKRRNLPPETETLRVTCSNGVYDYHAVGQRLTFGLDGVIYVLARAP